MKKIIVLAVILAAVLSLTPCFGADEEYFDLVPADEFVIFCDFAVDNEQFIKRREVLRWLQKEFHSLVSVSEQDVFFRPYYSKQMETTILEKGDAWVIVCDLNDIKLNSQVAELVSEFDARWLALGKGKLIRGQIQVFNSMNLKGSGIIEASPKR
ncbi:MAG: hypothetical protein GY793_11205 [Proteobacteria bacterium]|nr:hypothetical protein [Pseudomonadota bacterium]